MLRSCCQHLVRRHGLTWGFLFASMLAEHQGVPGAVPGAWCAPGSKTRSLAPCSLQPRNCNSELTPPWRCPAWPLSPLPLPEGKASGSQAEEAGALGHRVRPRGPRCAGLAGSPPSAGLRRQVATDRKFLETGVTQGAGGNHACKPSSGHPLSPHKY